MVNNYFYIAACKCAGWSYITFISLFFKVLNSTRRFAPFILLRKKLAVIVAVGCFSEVLLFHGAFAVASYYVLMENYLCEDLHNGFTVTLLITVTIIWQWLVDTGAQASCANVTRFAQTRFLQGSWGCCAAVGLRPRAKSPHLPIRSLHSLPHLWWGANGGCGGKEAKPPAPPTAAQRKLIYGIAAPQGPRFHMKDEAA